MMAVIMWLLYTCSNGYYSDVHLLYIYRAAFSTKTIKIGDHSILFQIWDTAGQEKVINRSHV